MIELVLIEAENYHDTAKQLPVPVAAFMVCQEDNPDIVLIYDEAA